MKLFQSKVYKTLKKTVIVFITADKGDFISSIFTKDKKDGNKKIKLNLKKFNQLVNYKHFKMESIKMTLIYLSQMCIWHLLTTKMHFFSEANVANQLYM